MIAQSSGNNLYKCKWQRNQDNQILHSQQWLCRIYYSVKGWSTVTEWGESYFGSNHFIDFKIAKCLSDWVTQMLCNMFKSCWFDMFKKKGEAERYNFLIIRYEHGRVQKYWEVIYILIKSILTGLLLNWRDGPLRTFWMGRSTQVKTPFHKQHITWIPWMYVFFSVPLSC